MLCEDGDQSDGNALSLLGLLPNGQSFEFARNNLFIAPGDADALANEGHDPAAIGTGNFSDNEFAGATFSSNGQWLFLSSRRTRHAQVAVSPPLQQMRRCRDRRVRSIRA